MNLGQSCQDEGGNRQFEIADGNIKVLAGHQQIQGRASKLEVGIRRKARNERRHEWLRGFLLSTWVELI
jgi:hypothetical protein